MNVAVIAVGSELLVGDRDDSNGDWIAAEVERAGGSVTSRVMVPDDIGRIARAIRVALEDHDGVILSGGLGPTEDDRTRQALSSALSKPLETDPDMESRIGDLYRSRGYRQLPAHGRQALRPGGSRWILNPVGSAPGIAAHEGSRWIVALPGVPAELRAMFPEALRWAGLPRPAGVRRRTLKIAGQNESVVDDRLQGLYEGPGREATVLASSGIVEIRLRVASDDATTGAADLEDWDRRIAQRMGADLFGRDADTLPDVVGRLLVARGRTVATAESCTGGLVGGALTSVAGSSGWYRGGLVLYADDRKIALADVPGDVIRKRGAVSAEVARDLARAAQSRLGAHYGVGVTGIAGPGGGTEAKPVGLVFVAVTGPGDSRVRELRLPGDREMVRSRAVNEALDLLRRLVLDDRA
jgi:nicotinamide-nucleotide amidase